MPAFVVLTPEETATVRTGSIDEPAYRPFPGGRRAQLEREWEERATDEDDEPPPVELPRPTSFERVFAARYWRRHTVELALLLALVTPARSDLQIIALARAAGGPRSAATPGTRRVTLGPWDRLEQGIPLADVLGRLNSRQQTDLQQNVRSLARPLPPGLAASISELLDQLVPAYGSRVRELTQPILPSRRPREALEVRDANATALSILTPRWRSLQPESNPVPHPTALQVEEILRSASENDFITDDAAVFPGWARGGRPVSGWWEFRHGGRRMWIKNINVSTAETRTGADLVYVRTQPEAVVLVQYKLLVRDADGEAYVSTDQRLSGQLERMLSYRSSAEIESLFDYRLGPEFAFVKFIDNQGQTGLGEDELTRGRYLPASYVADMLAGEPQGKRGGRSLYVERERGLESSVFVGLVRECWIGSRGDVTSVLARTVGAPSAILTLAVDQPADVPSPPIQ